MIKRAEAMVKEIKEQMRGGEGEVVLTHIFSPDEILGQARLIAKITLAAGSSIGSHQHINEEEIFYILKGSVVIDDNGQEQTLQAGDASLTLGGQSHSIRNDSDQVAELLALILLY